MQVPISFEYFPPKTTVGDEKLQQVAKQLAENNPQYFSVTFGAGGSTCKRTQDTVAMLQNTTSVPVAPHLSCISSDAAEITAILEHYQNMNVQRIVALRGDHPSGSGASCGSMRYGSDLVSLIRKQCNAEMHIAVGAYPEAHPESENILSEIKYFKQKVLAGANSAITQYFYNPDAYFRFCDLCQKENITIPIIPGIMPIYNLNNLQRFSKVCGAEIPKWLQQSLLPYATDQDAQQQIGIEFLTKMCDRLISGGAPALHFYSLNQAPVCQRLLKQIKINQ